MSHQTAEPGSVTEFSGTAKRETVHPWKIIEQEANQIDAQHRASLFMVGNGYIGMRGSQEDSFSKADGTDGRIGTYLNGFYEAATIRYGEVAYGYARESQTQLNVVNPLPICLEVDGERFDFDIELTAGRISDYLRTLSMSAGRLERSFIWTARTGRQYLIESSRLVVLSRKHDAAQSYRVTPLDQAADIRLTARLDGDSRNKQAGSDPRVGSGLKGRVLQISAVCADPTTQTLSLEQSTMRSGLALACAAAHRCCVNYGAASAGSPSLPERVLAAENQAITETSAEISYHVQIEKRTSVELQKFISFIDSRETRLDDMSRLASAACTAARHLGLAGLAAEQLVFLDAFWQRSQVQLKGDLALQQGLNFNIFQLLQSVGRDGKTNISAKGLSGEGYEGHYFWDTEMFMLPFFLYTTPAISRALLAYRYSILPKARERARELGHAHGALFPWRTISGEECSAYFPAGTAQYHIDADVAFAVKRYEEATGDREFLWEMGAEMLFETAEFWLCLGFYNPRKGNQFCINGVTGPDEYNALVDNNYYTNLMAQVNLCYAAETAASLAAEDSSHLAKLAGRLGYAPEERAGLWQQAADSMYLPYDKIDELCLQDDDFLDRIPWDFAGTPRSQYPLLLHYHPLVIYRHRVCKQADMVLAQFLQGHRFSYTDKKHVYDYYEACTTHDSSLSASIFSIMACELGYSAKAFRYFMETARMDLDDRHGNTEDGIHLANMAGTWMALIHGYGGMRCYNGQLGFRPQIAREWESYQFRLVFQGALLNVAVSPRGAQYELLEGYSISFLHFGEPITLTSEQPSQSVSLRSVVPEPREAIQAVIFDVDGVLLSTDEQHYLAWKHLADHEGIYFDRHLNQRLRGISRLASLEVILEKAGRAYSDEEKRTLAEQKNNDYQALIGQLTEQALLPGVIDFIHSLKRAGIKIAAGSSSRNAPTLLRQTGIEGLFDATVDGNNIAHSKPDPEVFLMAARKLGLPPAVCLVVEDATAGIEAAQAAGMRTLAVGDAAEQALSCRPDMRAVQLKGLTAEDVLDIL